MKPARTDIDPDADSHEGQHGDFAVLFIIEYVIQVQFVVDAHDDEEAADIARAVRENILIGHGYKLRDVETAKIEEL